MRVESRDGFIHGPLGTDGILRYTAWMRGLRVLWRMGAAGLSVVLAGCSMRPANPSFPISTAAAERDLQRMSADPKPLVRPLVVVSGFLDPGIAALSLQSQFRDVTGDSRIGAISLFECMSFEACRRKVIDVVDRAFPCADPQCTSEIDVVGFSMGGLAARLAANPPPGVKRRLRIRRLFTIDSPNQGADRAWQLPVLHPLQRDMRAGSELLVRLNAAPPDYVVFAYVRLDDLPIGPPNAAVAGSPLWWVPTPPFSNPHAHAYADPRLRADIARRLRGEMPLAALPPTPLPATK